MELEILYQDEEIVAVNKPHGIAVHGDTLFIIDVGSKDLLTLDTATGAVRSLAENLPVGAPPGVVPVPLQAIGNLSGPMTSFAGITVGADGVVYVAGDGEGSVLVLSPR